ncbi:MAG TPA: S8 family serine peptidase [Jatrophihabitantaceae bacterium]|nr:S8 family serine peptidase [Jatrophihabitantaceae bacterium]
MLDPAAARQSAAPNGTVRVAVDGDAAVVAARVGALGGRVLASAAGASSIVMPKAHLTQLAATVGVRHIETLDRPYADDGPPPSEPSQAVAASGSDQWQTAGDVGAGVKLAIVDLGFGDTESQYSTELSAGHLGATTQVVNEDCTDSNNIPTPYDGSSHGLAVAEVAQQQAPATQLFLYCVGSPAGVAQAEANIEAEHITIVSSSLAWFDDSRGDGSPPAGSVAASAERARQHGILWINAAGNYVQQHWSGTLIDSNHDGLVDIGNKTQATFPFESDFFYAAPGTPDGPTSLDFYLQWDQWPTAPLHDIQLQAYGVQCEAAVGSGGLDNCDGEWLNGEYPIAATNSVGEPGVPADQPAIDLDTAEFGLANEVPYPQIWQVQVVLAGPYPVGAHYDLFGLGDTSYASALACPTANSVGECNAAPAPAAQGSVIAPSTSPYVMAVGAADVGADGVPPGTFEPFSSQGPTIDGRVKPDIMGWDGLSSYVSDVSDGFYGTSAATPSVAGAAALVAAANPGYDAAQLQNFLEQRANNGNPQNPPTNTEGHGLLTLGAFTGGSIPVPGAGYTALPSPVRVLDTRNGTGVDHVGALAPFQAITVSTAAAGVPANATAVAVNLTGVLHAPLTYLSVYPGGTSWPGTSNLNLAQPADNTAASFAIVTLGAGRTVDVRSGGGATDALLDVVGYFSPTSASMYTPVTPTRIFDSRISQPGGSPTLNRGEVLPITPSATTSLGIPTSATSVIVNVTAARPAGLGYFSASPDGSVTSSTLNFQTSDRANLAIVGLNADGAFDLASSPVGASAGAVVDIVGYFSPAGTSGFVALPAPVRIMDTRSGNGPLHGVLGAGRTATLFTAGLNGVPYNAAAVVTGATVVAHTGVSYLELYPTGSARPTVSSLNYSAGRTVANGLVANLSNQQTTIYNNLGTADVIVDLFGYFTAPAEG